jgi:hypothetical protein
MRKSGLILSVFALLFLSSCLSIYEKYTINKDGSGTMEYLIDMNELHSLMLAFSDSSESVDGNMEIDQSFRDILPSVEKIPGISDVRLSGSPENYTYGIKFGFTDQVALNRALNLILGQDPQNTRKYVEIKKHKFIRFPVTNKEITGGDFMAKNDTSDNKLAVKMLEEMKYNIEVNFPESRVRKLKTGAETIEKSIHSVDVRASFSQIIDNNEVLKTEIKSR